MKTSEEETEKVKDIELNAGNNWSETIEGLLKYEDGKEYVLLRGGRLHQQETGLYVFLFRCFYGLSSVL